VCRHRTEAAAPLDQTSEAPSYWPPPGDAETGPSVAFAKGHDASKACISRKVLSFIRYGDRKVQMNLWSKPHRRAALNDLDDKQKPKNDQDCGDHQATRPKPPSRPCPLPLMPGKRPCRAEKRSWSQFQTDTAAGRACGDFIRLRDFRTARISRQVVGQIALCSCGRMHRPKAGGETSRWRNSCESVADVPQQPVMTVY
jgi:hypothetical protein